MTREDKLFRRERDFAARIGRSTRYQVKYQPPELAVEMKGTIGQKEKLYFRD
jgi:hypothetical protein